MKTKSIILSVLMIFSFSALSAQGKKANNLETVVFDVPMTCEKCKKTIEGNIAFEKGVKDLEVFLKDKKVSVTFDKTKTNIQNLQAAFEKIDRPATLPTTNQALATASKEQTEKKSSCCKSENKEEKTSSCSDEKKKENCKANKEEKTSPSEKEKPTKPRKRAESCCR